ncbi:heavy metal-associated isoprenylated plant protein 47-like [Cicer arietinum]|uniref:Heavy metal-associated isoprenylated plant protein 47-like isoform X2 n=1 Tax=Cicer arietinum TaxID=3827 RepID=A0A1S2XM82_CICAR|nr:heavy metal-associated isoprenylated plant protein 47-like isoform X2 [Cicer arietinum]
MKQKIVIEVPLHCAKCKKKILAICTTADGVETVTLEREGRDRVVIKGEDVDAARVTQCLREKVTGYARLVSVAKDES